MADDIIPLADAAAKTRELGFGVPYHTLQRACQNGDVIAHKIAGRWVINSVSLEDYILGKLETSAA